MAFDDDFPHDIFRIIDKIFDNGRIRARSPYIRYEKSERIINDNHIYYTFETIELEKRNINVKAYPEYLEIHILKGIEGGIFKAELPHSILPDKTKVTFINGILDITTKIDKSMLGKIEIEGDETKYCSRCKHDKKQTEFNKNKSAKDSLQRWCRTCQSNYKKHRSEEVI